MILFSKSLSRKSGQIDTWFSFLFSNVLGRNRKQNKDADLKSDFPPIAAG
jgi:hypothetical protein